ncbi:MAG: beta strand repeat-containing protein [Fimbriiglobus sp.]
MLSPIIRFARSLGQSARSLLIQKSQARPSLTLQSLEARDVPATFTVTNTNDAGTGSLRDAITQANSVSGSDTVIFQPGLGEIVLTQGLLLLDPNGTVTIQGPASGSQVIRRSSAPGTAQFGVFFINTGVTANLSGLTISGGDSAGSGGGIASSGNLTLANSTISGNTSVFGGGVSISAGTAVISNSVISQNNASGDGGGLRSIGDLTINNSLIVSNQTSGGGGGLLNKGTLTMSNSSVFANQSGVQGGGLRNLLGEAKLTNTSFLNNVSGRFGGGIDNGATLTLVNSTITGNRTKSDSGGGFSAYATDTVFNSIIAGNFVGETGTTPNDVAFGIDTGKNNLIGNAGTAGGLSNGTNGNIVGNNGAGTINIDTVLTTSEWVLNGGQTPTRGLASGSPALDKGDKTLAGVPGTDQRGVARVFGPNVDIGAVEFQSMNFVVDTTLDKLDILDLKTALREAVFAAQVNPGRDTITFSPGQTLTLNGTELPIASDVTIDGGVAGTTISGDNKSSIFNIDDLNFEAQSSVTLRNLHITAGKSPADGGAIFSNENLTIENTTISASQTGGYGGGIRNGDKGTLSLTNVTLSGNTALAAGGAIYNSSGLVANFITVTNNKSTNDLGGGIGTFQGVATSQTRLSNSIVAGNFKGTTPSDIAERNLDTASANNIIGDAASAGGLTNTNGNTIGVTVSSLLNTTLANNGGPAPTHALVPGSKALSGGGSFATDQRGFPRNGPVNIGAWQNQNPVVTPSTLPQGVVGTTYNQSLSAGFANQPAGTTYSFTGNVLPGGLALSGNTIQGTPTTAATTTFGITATASTGDFGITPVTLAIVNSSSVNTPPVARDDTATTKQATAVTIDILANDTDANDDPLTVVVGNAANGTVTFVNGKAIYTPNAQFVGEDFFGYTVTDGKGGPPATARATITVTRPVTPPVTPPVVPPAARENLLGSSQFATGSDFGGRTATLYNADRSVRFTVTPFGNITGGVRVAVADFDLDGIGDLVVGTGPGGPTQVKVINGKTQAIMFEIAPFEAAFTGGVFVAAGSLTGEFGADLAISPDEGGGPRVRMFGGIGGGPGKSFQVADFFGIDDPAFRGGARVAMGDINGDQNADLVVAAGFGGGPRVAAFSGASFFVNPNNPDKLFGDFAAFEDTLRNGTYVTVGDTDGDGKAEIIASGGPGGGPRVSVFSATDLVRNVQTRLNDYFAGDANSRSGVRVAVKNLDGDNKADIVTAPGPEANRTTRVTSYAGAALRSGQPPELFNFDTGFAGGVFVG